MNLAFNSSLSNSINKIQLNQLQILLKSNVLGFNLIQPEQIISQQHLLIYFTQKQKQIQKKLTQSKLQLQIIVRKIINDQLLASQTNRNRNHRQLTNTQSTEHNEEIQQNQHQQHQQQLYAENSKYLCKQIIKKIVNYFPNTHKFVNCQNLPKFSFSHCQKLLDLVDIEIKQQQSYKQITQVCQIIQRIVLPILYLYPETTFKSIEIVKAAINYFSENQSNKILIFHALSQAVTNFYFKMFQQCAQNDENNESNTISKIVSVMTAIQVIHCSSQFYNEKLVKSSIFHHHIYKMLLSSNADTKTGNLIAINMYGSLLKQINAYSHQSQIFITLYSTLRCFGAHLIKDIWSLFYDFIELQTKNEVFSKAQLIDIIFYKIQHHQNANVVKHCVQSILQEKRSFILFNKVPDAIYISLIRILNYGMHYLDCMFHMDSKMFSMISNFFGDFFNAHQICPDSIYQHHLRQFLRVMTSKVSYDHALVGMLNSFTLIKRKSRVVTKEVLVWISNLVSKYYIKFPIRKRHQLMKGVCDLLRNHLNAKSIQQTQCRLKVNDNTQNSVDLSYLIRTSLFQFPQEYILLSYCGEQKKDDILQIISMNYSPSEINDALQQFAQSIKQVIKGSNEHTKSQILQIILQNLRSIQFILFLTEKQKQQTKYTYQQKSLLSRQTSQILQFIFTQIYEKYIIEIGQSLYKRRQERIQAIYIQKQCLEKIFALRYFALGFNDQRFIQKSLTNISLLAKSYIEDQKIEQNNGQVIVLQYLTKKLFSMIYKFSESENKQMEEKVSRIGSQFLQWAADNIVWKQCYLLIISALKARIQQSKQFEIQYIEESVYTICCQFFSYQYREKHKDISCISNLSNINVKNIPATFRLRLLVLSYTILFNDENELKKYFPQILEDIQQFGDRYDFQNLDQIYYLIELVFTQKSQTIRKCFELQNKIKSKKQKQQNEQKYDEQKQLKQSKETEIKISKLIYEIIYNMLSSLNYGIDVKQITTSINCASNILFYFAQRNHYFSQPLVELCLKIITIGQEYWMFSRMLAFKILENLNSSIQKHQNINYQNIFPLLSKIIQIQQYRGYDSAIALEEHLVKDSFYTELKLNLSKQADYEGITCRLAIVELINQFVEISMGSNQNHHLSNALEKFLVDFFKYLISEIRKQTKQRMFLTGQHKAKLQHWQCLMAFHPEWIYRASKLSSFIPIQQLIIFCIQMVNQSSLNEIKYYLELFLMKLLINNHSEQIITPNVLNLISSNLLQIIAHINKNMSFIVIGGMVMNHLFKNYSIHKKHPLFQSLQILYNGLLSYSCSHIAYFRGLSQYFCLQTLFIQSQYTRILHSTIRQDPDTIILRQRLHFIITGYYNEVFDWNVRNNLFKQIPNLNSNITSETFYIDKMKNLGQELLRQVKGQIGFLPYKSIWIQAVKSLNIAHDIQIDLDKEALNLQIQQQSIFQRKIDPSLDFIYFSKTKLEGFQMKILITGSKSIPIYGHLSRTGEIFGLSQLIVPYKQITDDEQYKNVSCTAQKWLNIKQFSKKNQILEKEKFKLSLQKELLNIKQQGYTFFLLKKHQILGTDQLKKQLDKVQNCKKILLVLDQEELLPASSFQLISQVICFGEYFSQHVQASIFIWQYFRQVYDKKFRNSQQK